MMSCNLVLEKRRYIHRNPVHRGLCASPISGREAVRDFMRIENRCQFRSSRKWTSEDREGQDREVCAKGPPHPTLTPNTTA